MFNTLSRFADPVYCLMRLIVGLLFAAHGAQKLLGWFPKPGQEASGIDFQTGLAGGIELIGGLLIAVGLLTRVSAFLSSGLMAVAYFKVHVFVVAKTTEAKLFPILNGGELAVLYCFIFFFIFFYGPGRLSLDALIFRNRAAAAL
jgi:putative oxidoreductase